MPPSALRENTLWELAAACGLHRIETFEERDNREIVQTKEKYWEETGEARSAKLTGYREQRRARALERAKQRASSGPDRAGTT